MDVLGISYDMKKIGDIIEDNISRKINDMKNLISVWKMRKLHVGK